MATDGYRSKIDWDEAFAFYASLGPTRRCGEVAAKFGVSETSVRKHATAGTWRERAEILDRQAAQQAERAVVRDRSERIAHTIRLVDKARERFEAQLDDLAFTVSANGFVDLVKLEQLLEGGPTERHAGAGLDGLLGRLRVAVNGGELERALEAGDLNAARRALKEAKR